MAAVCANSKIMRHVTRKEERGKGRLGEGEEGRRGERKKGRKRRGGGGGKRERMLKEEKGGGIDMEKLKGGEEEKGEMGNRG